MRRSDSRTRKAVIAGALVRSGLIRTTRAGDGRSGSVRVVNYHGVPPRLRSAFAGQVDHLLERYRPCSPSVLTHWPPPPEDGGPRILFTFDDGLRNQYDVAAEVLEKRGVRAAFAVPAAFPSVPERDQPQWFRKHVRAAPTAEHAGDADLLAMSWHQARDLVSRGHVVCCHTETHRALVSTLERETLRRETTGARFELEANLGTPIDGFCWPLGRRGADPAAESAVRTAFRYALVGNERGRSDDPFRIARSNLEASWSFDVVDLQTSMLADAAGLLRSLRGGW